MYKNGKELIKSYEGCSLKAYKCPAGRWTIGWGRTTNVHEGDTCTQEQADKWFDEEYNIFESKVKKLIKVDVSENKIWALTSFAYNCGISALQQSTLLKKLNAKDYVGASNEFLKWNKAGGKVLAGLTLRRNAERDLFLKHEVHHNGNNLPYEVKTKADLNIRIAPSTTSAIIRTVPTGTILKVWAIQTVGGKTWGKNGAQYFCLDYCEKI